MQQSIKDVSWRLIIKGQVVIIGDINVYSTVSNCYCYQKHKIDPLENLIKTYRLIVNNNTNSSTCLSSHELLFIDFALTNFELGLPQI